MPKTVNFNPVSDYDLEAANIERRRKMAEQLAVAAGQFPDQTQVISGVAVKQSPLIGAAKLAQALMAHKSLKEADAAQKALSERMNQDRMSTLTDFQNLMQGQSGRYEQLPPGVFGPEQELQAPTPANPQAAMMRLMQSGDPMFRQMATQQILSSAMPKQGEAFTLKPGDIRYGANGQVIAKADAKPEKPFIRTRVLGDQEVQEQLQPDGTYQEIGRGPRFARQVAPVVVNSGGGGGMGKPPSGYRFTPSGELEAIPGGPADQKKQGQYNADTASMQATESAMNRLAEFANSVKAAPGLKGITGIRGAIPNIPGSDAANAQAQLDTLKSQVAFGVLQAMRDASKTGGALGAVSEKELVLLQNNLAALDKAQSFEQFQKSLDGIIKYTEEAKGRMRNAYNLKHGDKAQVEPKSSGGSSGGWSIQKVQ